MGSTQLNLSQSDAPLQLLLFLDDRFKTKEELIKIRSILETLSGGTGVFMQEINVAQAPHLTEYYRVIATPTLVRVAPEPRQILAGTDIAVQLEYWWPSWQELIHSDSLLKQQLEHSDHEQPPASRMTSLEHIQFADEIFRLKQENADLLAQLWFKERIITILAHDLRNPLTSALLSVDTLLLQLKESLETLEHPFVQQLLNQTRRQLILIERMTTDLLESGLSSEHKLKILPTKTDLADLCQEAIEKLEKHWQQKSQTVNTDIPSDLPWVYVDQERIQQVLLNLLGNAIKYTPSQGKIHLSVLHRTTQKVQVSVCDNGPGIPDNESEKIFEDSFRLERDAEAEGYGIGLALCQKIVQAHYGTIWVDSVLGQGSCFHFTLPTYPYADTEMD